MYFGLEMATNCRKRYIDENASSEQIYVSLDHVESVDKKNYPSS